MGGTILPEGSESVGQVPVASDTRENVIGVVDVLELWVGVDMRFHGSPAYGSGALRGRNLSPAPKSTKSML